MTAEDLKMLQEKILRLVNAAGKFGLPEARLLRTLASLYPDLQTPQELRDDKSAELERQLRYLKSKGWIVEVPGALRPDLRSWETTAAGDEYLMGRGFI